MKRLFTINDEIQLNKMSTRDGRKIDYCSTEGVNMFYCIGAVIRYIYPDGRDKNDVDSDLMIEVPDPVVRKDYVSAYEKGHSIVINSIERTIHYASSDMKGIIERTWTDGKLTSVRLMDKSEYENLK